MNEVIKYGTIGTSWITKSFINGTKYNRGMVLSAVYSRNIQKAMEFAKENGAELYFDSLEEMALSDKVDAVYIASPNALHYEQSKLFLESRKHVICEKALTSEPWKVHELFEIAKRNNVVFMEAIFSMYTPPVFALEKCLERIGKISLAKIDFCKRTSEYEDFKAGRIPNIFNPLLEGGALMDLGVYCVHLAVRLFGYPSMIHSSASIEYNGCDTAGVSIFDYGFTKAILTYGKTTLAINTTEFQGELGTVTVDTLGKMTEINVWFHDGKTEKHTIEDDKDYLMSFESNAFYNYIVEPRANEMLFEKNKKQSLEVVRALFDIRKKAGLI